MITAIIILLKPAKAPSGGCGSGFMCKKPINV